MNRKSLLLLTKLVTILEIAYHRVPAMFRPAEIGAELEDCRSLLGELIKEANKK